MGVMLYKSSFEGEDSCSKTLRILAAQLVDLEGFRKDGRGGEIRTHDLLYPKQAR
jgi:hypothetical protein